jgi:hypothetical protein
LLSGNATKQTLFSDWNFERNIKGQLKRKPKWEVCFFKNNGEHGVMTRTMEKLREKLSRIYSSSNTIASGLGFVIFIVPRGKHISGLLKLTLPRKAIIKSVVSGSLELSSSSVKQDELGLRPLLVVSGFVGYLRLSG